MAYFHCLIGGGSSGGGYTLTVTCDPNFAGTTIICTDGVTTLTKTCPSVSPYEVEFEIPNGGTWTVSGTISGSTFTASIDIHDELELIAIPDGSTVTPTDDIQTWLKCGGIFDKSYTTLNEVLADSTTLLALMSDDNAVDYLVRSTTWASGITADSTAMTDIGANNYCANTLLADSTWLTAICNSTYFESVLNVKVPTMTSNTTPSGECFGDSINASTYTYFKAFDKNRTDTYWVSASSAFPHYCGYDFGEPTKISVAVFNNVPGNHLPYSIKTYKIQGSNESKTSGYVDLTDSLVNTNTDSDDVIIALNNNTAYRYYRIYVINGFDTVRCDIGEINFYGRADV